jgi:hypothetical protein
MTQPTPAIADTAERSDLAREALMKTHTPAIGGREMKDSSSVAGVPCPQMDTPAQHSAGEPILTPVQMADALRRERARGNALELDAARFRALMRCGRIKMQGSAGVDPHTGERRPGSSVHFGAELWPEYLPQDYRDKHPEEAANYDRNTRWGIACIKALADAIIERDGSALPVVGGEGGSGSSCTDSTDAPAYGAAEEAQSDLDLVRELRSAAEGSRMMAEAATAVAKHFRVPYEACWRDGPGQGPLINSDAAMRLRPYTIEKEQEAKSWLNDEALLNRAADRIAAIAQSEGQS